MTDNLERAQVEWDFGLRWVVASIVGLAVGLVLPFLGSFGPSMTGFTVPLLWIAVGGFVVGASLGIAQMLPLRWRKVGWDGWWLAATIVGMTVGWVVASATGGVLSLGTLDQDFVNMGVAVVVVGASLGIAQWPVLRGQVPRASWWLLASIVASAVSAAALVVGMVIADEIRSPSVLFLLLVPMTLYGTVTGIVMVWLLRYSAEEQTSLS